MSISTLESPASRRALDQLHAEEAYRERAEQALAETFKQALQGDLSAPCVFKPSYLHSHNGAPVTVGDVLFDALDSKDFGARAMVVLANAAAGRGTQRDAQQLLDEVTTRWAESNVDMVL